MIRAYATFGVAYEAFTLSVTVGQVQTRVRPNVDTERSGFVDVGQSGCTEERSLATHCDFRPRLGVVVVEIRRLDVATVQTGRKAG